MQAASLPFTSGWHWIQNGFALFKRQPIPMLFWSLMTTFLISVGYLLPLFGPILLITFTPTLTFISLSACRNIAQGKPMLLNMWLEPLQLQETRRRLLALGLAYTVVCLAGGLFATLPFLGELNSAIDVNGAIDEVALAEASQGPLMVFGLLYIVISGFFWHAPALIGWHRIKMSQALFFSMVACWRNKWPFLAYGLSWAAIFFGIQLAGSFIISLGVAKSTAEVVLTPLNIIAASVLYCSFYPAYMSVFGSNYQTNN